MFSRLAAILGLRAADGRDDLSDRATVVTLFARFIDELCSGLLVLLMPTLRARLGLTIQQTGWCYQALFSIGAVVEPISGVMLDVVRRRPLLVAGAAGWAAALLLAAGATSFWWMLAAFALAGAAYGPLANTADVVLVEGHPSAVERIVSRSTALGTIGALLAPGAVAIAGWAGLERSLLAAAGVGTLGYALLSASSALPPPVARPHGSMAWGRATANIRAVIAERQARIWIGALLLTEVLDLPQVFEPVWLRDVVGVSQTLVAVHVAIGVMASSIALVVLDHWLVRHDAMPVLLTSCLATLLLYPAWLLAPGFGVKLGLVGLRDAAMAPLWPILHSRALAAVPGKAGAVSAVTALIGLLPVHAALGWLAGRVGLTSSMLSVQVAATLGLLALLRSGALRSASDADP